jgi:hypothetical protein
MTAEFVIVFTNELVKREKNTMNVARTACLAIGQLRGARQ